LIVYDLSCHRLLIYCFHSIPRRESFHHGKTITKNRQKSKILAEYRFFQKSVLKISELREKSTDFFQSKRAEIGLESALFLRLERYFATVFSLNSSRSDSSLMRKPRKDRMTKLRSVLLRSG